MMAQMNKGGLLGGLGRKMMGGLAGGLGGMLGGGGMPGLGGMLGTAAADIDDDDRTVQVRKAYEKKKSHKKRQIRF